MTTTGSNTSIPHDDGNDCKPHGEVVMMVTTDHVKRGDGESVMMRWVWVVVKISKTREMHAA